jgi:hypothetical protein
MEDYMKTRGESYDSEEDDGTVEPTSNHHPVF